MSRVWMITGAGRGLGRAFVQEAAARGDQVIAAVRKVPEGDALFQKENVLPVLMDVTDKAAVKTAVQAGVRKFGKIDVLINNAGYGISGAFEEVEEETLRNLFEADYFGVLNVTREVLPVMRQQQSGMILNVSSQAGAMGFQGSTAYCSAKFAVVGFTEALRAELEGFHIQAASVLPGAFRTDFRDASSMVYARNPMKEYDGSAAHKARETLIANNYKQMGDPAKAARFLYGIVESGKLPKRILVGQDCCEAVRKDLEEQIREIDSYIRESSRTAFDE